MRPLTVIQARMGSERLPGKALAKIGDKTALEWVLHQLRRCGEDLGRIVVATPWSVGNSLVEYEALRLGVASIQGPEDDVLRRFVLAHAHYGGEPIIRVTADTPFLDPGLLDRVVRMIATGDYDYVGVTGAPDGYHAEAFTVAALYEAAAYAVEPGDREHVVPWMIRNGNCGWVEANIDGPPVALDTPADLERLRAMVA